ncbi:MAG: type IV secretion system protein [Arenimonas sp.]
MTLRNKAITPNIENALSQSINYEVTIVDIARRSERRAWFVAFAAILMSLLLAGGYYYMLPLKEKVPYLVMADAYTGTSTVAQLRGDFATNSITTSEAINTSNVAHFVLARESYDANLIGQRDWDTVFTMASPEVAADYRALHASTNPNSPYKLYNKSASIRIKILSTSLIRVSKDAMPTGATVRFQRVLFNRTSGVTEPMDSKIATIQFTYKNNLKMDDQKRILNPLGFQVMSYRVDNDYSAAVPMQIEMQQQPTAVPAESLAPAEVVPGQAASEIPTNAVSPATGAAPPQSNGVNNR